MLDLHEFDQMVDGPSNYFYNNLTGRIEPTPQGEGVPNPSHWESYNYHKYTGEPQPTWEEQLDNEYEQIMNDYKRSDRYHNEHGPSEQEQIDNYNTQENLNAEERAKLLSDAPSIAATPSKMAAMTLGASVIVLLSLGYSLAEAEHIHDQIVHADPTVPIAPLPKPGDVFKPGSTVALKPITTVDATNVSTFGGFGFFPSFTRKKRRAYIWDT